jgi:Flp pilus assembly protein TadG
MSPGQPRKRTSGTSVVEFSLIVPWAIFLFVGAFDWGFYAHALISIEDATREAALYAANLSSGNPKTSTACSLVLNELSISANVANLSTCTSGTVSSSQPVGISLSCTTLDSLNAVKVTVTYQTLQLIPIPGVLSGQVTLTRSVELPMNNNSSCTVS